MTQFLIVGGAGYIGSHVVRELTRQGHGVVVYRKVQRSEIRCLRSDARGMAHGAEADVRGQESDVGCRRTQVGSRESGDGRVGSRQ